ncbi:hypothetical protein RCL_jg20432.t1 [Rhizophagus clarus]|uniref:Uncharacterized protein n=1 Tax=Rhizophagus clarus TaxID=94130 RepID=A0A8H3KUF6_9GLOM|nr:hypothetical protein RCL_jg20432.t1 [Rhizophagus clarus]
MILNDSTGDTEIKVSSTPRRPTSITPSITLNNDNPPPKITLKSSDDKIKPSEDSINIKGKKRKQDYLTENFSNSNLILTEYSPIEQE